VESSKEEKGKDYLYGAIKDMCEGASTSVRKQNKATDDFPITIGYHQGSR